LEKARQANAMKAAGDRQVSVNLTTVVDNNIAEFCDVGGKGAQRSLGEKEQDFLMAMQSFYEGGAWRQSRRASFVLRGGARRAALGSQRAPESLDNPNAPPGAPMMSNEEFDNLKSELLWAGSQVAVLSKDEQRFLEASLAFAKGAPLLSDVEYDALKLRLKEAGSVVAVAGPRCSLRSQRVYSDSTVDYARMTALNLPGALLGLAVCFLFDDVTGFKVSELVELPEPYGVFALWGIVLPCIYFVSAKFTSIVLKDSLVLKGPCPSCGQPVVAYFGDILGVEGEKSILDCTCGSCNQLLNFSRSNRTITLVKN